MYKIQKCLNFRQCNAHELDFACGTGLAQYCQFNDDRVKNGEYMTNLVNRFLSCQNVSRLSRRQMMITSFAIVALIGCSQHKMQNNSEEANQKIEQMNLIAKELRAKDVQVSSDGQPSERREVPQYHNVKDLLVIHVLLTRYISLGQDVLALARHRDVNVNGTDTVHRVELSIQDANQWLKKVDSRIDELRTGKKAQPAPTEDKKQLPEITVTAKALPAAKELPSAEVK